MITTTHEHAIQIELDFATDATRLDRQNFQRACDDDLHALVDYVSPDQYIIWRPGTGGQHGARAFDVQIATQSACTCQQWRLKGHCPHSSFAARLDENSHTIGTDTPLAAREI